MTTDLPKRPERDPDEQGRIVKPTDRVKSASDKPDPRFEAARLKAEREERLRAEHTARRDGESAVTDPSDDTTSPDDGESEGDPVVADDQSGFSFNKTAGDAEEDQ